MTREHKLALIVGFSLVLLVGVLIADHLSLARRAQIAPVGEEELTVARGPATFATDPLLSQPLMPPVLDPLAAAPEPQAAPAPQNVPLLMPEPQSEGSALPPSPDLALGGRDAINAVPAAMPEIAPPSDSLENQIARAGGTIDGGVIQLPPVVEVSRTREADTKVEPVTPKPTPSNKTLAVGPETPPPPPVKTYTVKKGDTYIKIAEKQYGRGDLWRALASYNGSKDGTVFLGTTIKLPAKTVLTGKADPATAPREMASPTRPAPKKAEPAPSKPSRTELAMTYTVKKGDTLGDISLKVLGTSRRWREIAELNKIDDEDMVTAGTVLKVPPMRG